MMAALTMENPVFVTYMIASAIMVLKLMGQGWMTVYRMLISDSGMASPEDLRPGLINRNPRPDQLDINDYVDRSRRMHRAAGPSYLLANILMYSFVGARLLHAVAYATKQSHEIRATLYSIGSLGVIVMAGYVLAATIF
jgi:hypothetical protein